MECRLFRVAFSRTPLILCLLVAIACDETPAGTNQGTCDADAVPILLKSKADDDDGDGIILDEDFPTINDEDDDIADHAWVRDDTGVYHLFFQNEGQGGPSDIEHYLTTSEQIDSRMALATDGKRTRGLLLQRMPSAGPDDDATWRRAATAIEVDAADLLHAGSVEAVLAASFPTDDLRVMKGRPLRFHCDCSSERVSNALRMLGRAEIESILAEQGTISVKCEFCGRSYTFGAADALALFPQTGATDAPASADTKRGE